MRSYALGLLAVLLGTSACERVSGSAVATAGATAYRGKVKLVSFEDPRELQEVGIVEVHGVSVLEELMEEFKKKAAEVGGSVGKVDSIRTRFEMQTRTFSESYSCGSSQSPRTCYRTVTRQVEVATTTVVGRAFR